MKWSSVGAGAARYDDGESLRDDRRAGHEGALLLCVVLVRAHHVLDFVLDRA